MLKNVVFCLLLVVSDMAQQVHVDTNNLLDSCRLRSVVINGPTLLGAAYIASNTS